MVGHTFPRGRPVELIGLSVGWFETFTLAAGTRIFCRHGETQQCHLFAAAQRNRNEIHRPGWHPGSAYRQGNCSAISDIVCVGAISAMRRSARHSRIELVKLGPAQFFLEPAATTIPPSRLT